MATLRWIGVPGVEVRMVEGTYEETKGKVVCGPGISEEFRMDVGLRQGSALSPLLFIAVVEVISMKASTRDIVQLLYTDGLAVVADFVYLGGAVCGDGGTEMEICRIQIMIIMHFYNSVQGCSQ